MVSCASVGELCPGLAGAALGVGVAVGSLLHIDVVPRVDVRVVASLRLRG